MGKSYVAVDLGSSSGKVILGWLTQDRKFDFREVHRFETPRTYVNGHICTNVYRIYDEICGALKKLGQEGVEIAGLGVDSWSSDYGLVNEAGILEGLPVFYRDKRTEGMVEEVEKVISYEELYPLSMQRRARDLTLCQLLALKRESPEALEKGRKILFLGDLIMAFFTGRICSEISVASYSQLFNMNSRRWESKVFERFSLPESIQPEIVDSGTKLGTVAEEVAKWCGVNRFEVIAPAVHDTSSAAVTVPAKKGESFVFISTGSWYLVSMELDKPADAELSYRFNMSNTGLAFGKTLLKKNVPAMWLIQECRRCWSSGGKKLDYEEIMKQAEAAEPFYGYIDTEAEDFYSPEHMPQAIMRYMERTGQRAVEQDNIGQIARLIYEGIAWKCACAVDELEKTTGQEIHKIYVIGGTSEVDYLNQMLASATGRKIETGLREASAVGNALLQAYGAGEVSGEEEIREIIRRTKAPKQYFPRDREKWKEKYRELIEKWRG